IEVVTARSGEHVWLRVIDHGPGIAPQDQERVFDRFARVAAGGSGLGIGLYISREIATAHGGHLDVESKPGTGTAFTLSLPARPSPQPDQPRELRPGA
ncbi:MAG: sensor histidine kinase, partial [Acidobacteriaceae bacterium]